MHKQTQKEDALQKEQIISTTITNTQGKENKKKLV